MQEALIVGLVFEVLESFADGVFRQRRNPQPIDRAAAIGFLHHPALNQLSLLTGIPAVDDRFGIPDQSFKNTELLLVAIARDQLDAEPRRNHGQRLQTPRFPFGRIIVRFFKRAEMAVCPRHLITVPLDIALSPCPRSEYFRNLAHHSREIGRASCRERV